MSSKFKDLMAHARSREGERSDETPVDIVSRTPRKPAPARRASSAAQTQNESEQSGSTLTISAPPITRRRGRPQGKRSHPDFEQITAYISKKTHRDTKIALLQKGDGKQFSELVEQLLSDWLKAG